MSNNSKQYSKQLESLFSDVVIPPPDPVKPAPAVSGDAVTVAETAISVEVTPASEAVTPAEAPKVADLPKLTPVPALSDRLPGIPVEALPPTPKNGKHASGPDFERLFEMSAEISCIVEPDGRFRQVNPACEAALGWNSTELSRRLFFELVHPDDVTAVAAEFQNLAKGAKKIQFESRFRCKNGRYRQLIWHLQTGADKALYAIARQPAESGPAAAVTETNWDRLFAGITDVILIYGADGRYLEIAPTNPSHLIRPPTELLGKTVHEVLPAEVAEAFMDYIRRALAGETLRVDYALPINGQTMWFDATISKFTEDTVFWIARDITERKQAEEALHQSRERYELAMHGTNDGLWDWDMVTNEVYFSPRWKAMLGYADHEIGASFEEFETRVHPEDLPRIQKLIVDYLGGAAPTYEAEIRMRHKDGVYRWILTRGKALWDENGKPCRMAGSDSDITELKQAAETLAQRAVELEETTRFLDSVIENLPTMLFVKDAEELRFVRWNKAGEELIGFKREDLFGKNDYDFFPKEEADFFTAKDRDVLAGGLLVDIPEEPIQTAYGTTRFLHTRKVPILGADGKSKYLLGISEDITERKRSEQIIGENEERFRVIASTTPIPVLISRAKDGLILYANGRLEELFGYTAEDLIGSVTPNLYYNLDDRQAVLNTVGQQGFVKDLEVQGRRKDGAPVWVSLSVQPITFSGESALLASFFDLTARRQSQAEIQRRNEELSALNRLISTATSSLDLYQLLKNTAKEMVQVLHLRNTGIALINADRQSLTVIADHNASPDEPSAEGVVLPIAGNTSAQYVIENKRSLVIANAQTDPMTETIHDLMRARRTTGLIILPLLARDQVIGTIGADITDPERRFTPEEVSLLETMARQLASAVDNIRLFEAAQRRANEMATVAQVSAAVSVTRDLDELLQKVVDLTKSSFNLYHAHVYLLNDLGDTLVLAAGAGEVGRTMTARGWTIALNREQSLVARAARTRRGVVVNDVTAEPGFLPNPLLPNTRSELAVPMIVGDKVIGVLDVQAEVPNRFDDNDVNVKAALASQVAIAVDNARSFERLEQALQELSKLARQLTREGWSEYFDASGSSNLGFVYDLARVAPLEAETRAEGEKLRRGSAHDKQSTIVQPLTVRGETIGQLTLEAVEKSDGETEAVIATIAERLSGHIENLRLTEQEQRRAAQLAKLSQIQSALSLAATEAEILSTVTLGVATLDWLALHYIETGEGDHPLTLNTVAVWKDGAIQPNDPTLGQRYPVTLFATTRLWLQNPDRLLYIADVENDPRASEDLRASARRAGYRAMCTMPLRSSGRWQGTINLSWPQINPLTPDEQFILEQIMEPLASAIASRRSYLAEQTARRENERRAAELETVAKLSTAASTLLDSQQLLQAVVDLTKERFDLYHAHIYLLDDTAQTLVLTAGAGEVGKRMVNDGRSIPLDLEHSIVATAARTRQPVVINDVRESPTFLPNSYLPNTRAEMAVPLVVGERVLGVFDVQSDEAGRFSTEDARIQVTLAAQIAVALQNATLFAEQTATVTRLRELDQLKSAFLANMSHELRTPLNSILGFTEVLIEGIDGPLTERMENDLKVVYKNGQHLLNLINDILDMAKIEAGKMRLSPEWFNLQEVLEEVIATTMPLANSKSLPLRLLTPADTVMQLEADRIRVRQVMLNLVNNALKFTDQGSVTVDAGSGDGLVRIMVRDTGVAIPSSQLESIFQEFHQVDSTTTRKAGGTGLGLPISRRLIELHGGRLWAESSGVPGEGSMFVVELPVESRYNRGE
jgi:PAS domain S-box-containing protein